MLFSDLVDPFIALLAAAEAGNRAEVEGPSPLEALFKDLPTKEDGKTAANSEGSANGHHSCGQVRVTWHLSNESAGYMPPDSPVRASPTTTTTPQQDPPSSVLEALTALSRSEAELTANCSRAGTGWTQFFQVRPSPIGGLGAFAVKDLRPGDVILTESPLLRTTYSSVLPDFYRLAKSDQDMYLTLSGYPSSEGKDEIMNIARANAFVARDGIAIFKLASRFNHACEAVRNVKYVYNEHNDSLTMTVVADVPAGTELTVSYGQTPTELYNSFGFICRCGGCGEEGLTEEEVQDRVSHSWY